MKITFAATLCRNSLRWAIVGFCLSVVAGCDAFFTSQLEVSYGAAVIAPGDPTLDAKVISALRAYARAEGHSCDEASVLPLRCAWMPITIFAFRTSSGAMVCYGAGGIPLESGKFRQRIQRLSEAFAKEDLSVAASPVTPAMPRACLDWAKAQRVP